MLRAAGERVVIVGCGTSYFMAQSAAALREEAGLGETDAFAASEFPWARAYVRGLAQQTAHSQGLWIEVESGEGSPSSRYSLTAFSTTNFRSLATSRLLPNRRRSLTW